MISTLIRDCGELDQLHCKLLAFSSVNKIVEPFEELDECRLPICKRRVMLSWILGRRLWRRLRVLSSRGYFGSGFGCSGVLVDDSASAALC